MPLEYYIPQGDLYTGSLSLENGSYGVLTYRSLSQLYYANFVDGVLQTSNYNNTGSFDNYLETSLFSGSRFLSGSAVVYSIPQNLFGTHIEPGSFIIGTDNDYLLNQDDYIITDYLEQSDPVYDDSEGALRLGGITGSVVGSIIYTHGQIVITDNTLAQYYRDNTLQPMSWKSNLPIYTYNYNIVISDDEYNFTYNPTAQSGSDGQLADNITGSYFQPYITTVGLYNDANELIAVAKLAQPLPKSANTEMTIQVKLDI